MEMYEIQPNGKMVPEFGEWTFSHKKNDTGIIQTSFGFHVMKLDSIFDTLEAQRVNVEFAYKSNEYQQKLSELLNNGEYKVEIKEGYAAY